MTDDEIEGLVFAKARPATQKVTDDLPMDLARVNAQFAHSNSLRSGAYLNRACGVVVEAIEKIAQTRCSAEREVHRRLGQPLIGERRKRILADLERDADERFAWLLGTVPGLRGPDGSPPKREAESKAKRTVSALVDELAAELALPPPTTSPSITLNMNAPNHGIVAGRIDSLNVGNPEAGRELQAKLREILVAIELLEEARANDARELLFALTQQAESKPQRSLVRAGADRLEQILSLGGAAARVLEIVRQLPDLIDRGAGVILS